jgi:dihydroorotase
MPDGLTIRRPDDWHLHLRDGTMLRAVLPATAAHFARAIVMPNLTPPVTDAAKAVAYRDRILAALPPGADFTPLMTCYMTDNTDPDEVARGHAAGVFTAVKLYPAGATTNSAFGVTAWENIRPVLARMEEIGCPLLVHGEEADPAIDIFDREAVFIERVLGWIVRDYPALKVVLEHITTEEGAAFVAGAGPNVAATITPHHLLINRNHILAGGIRPHMYCLPVAKRERHRLALRKAATSANASFFLGTDSAPHPRADKESDCGCAGIFNAASALACYAEVFEDEGALDRLEAFCSLNGPAFYGLQPNETTVTLTRADTPGPDTLTVEGGIEVRPFRCGETLRWRVDA